MIVNRLKELREQRGLAASELAREVGVRRQTIYAIESGEYMPNTAVSLRLADSLQVTVENLFQLASSPKARERSVQAEVLTASPASSGIGAGVRLCRVNGVDFAATFEWTAAGLPWVDGRIRRWPSRGKAEIEVFDDPKAWDSRLLLAGCDPAISLLTREVERATGGDVVVAPCSSGKALEWLHAGKVHVAGAHLRDPDSGEFNLPEVGRLFNEGEVTVLNYAHWEEGIVTAAGNPLGIGSAADLAGREVRLINREPGAGSRQLLDRSLQSCGIKPRQVSGYKSIAYGHFEAAAAVRDGRADACIATRYTASAFGLNFVPIETERYDLIVRTSCLNLPMVRALTDSITQRSLRSKLSHFVGYDTTKTGDRLC